MSSEVLLHSLGGVEGTDDGVDVFDDAGEVVVGFDRRELELSNEAVELVDDEDGAEVGEVDGTEDSDCLR